MRVQKLSWTIAWCLLAPLLAFAQAPAQEPPLSPPFNPEAAAPDIPGVVKGGTKWTLIKAGYKTVEGPTQAKDGDLLFTDREGNRIWKVDKNGNVSSYLETTNGSSSITIDPKGRVIAAQRLPAPGQVGVIAPTPQMLVDKFEGQPFPGPPNDLVADKKGGVYFTARHVYYLKPDGTLTRISAEIQGPNGVALSPDEKTLYVANTPGEFVIAFDVQPDGSVSNQRDFGRLKGYVKTEKTASSGSDGLAVDSTGRLYVVSNAGVEVFSPKGEPLGVIPIPITPKGQNLAFAGSDKKTLYVVGNGTVVKIPMIAEGFKGRAK